MPKTFIINKRSFFYYAMWFTYLLCYCSTCYFHKIDAIFLFLVKNYGAPIYSNKSRVTKSVNSGAKLWIGRGLFHAFHNEYISCGFPWHFVYISIVIIGKRNQDQEHGIGPTCLTGILSLLLNAYVDFGKLLNFSGPHFNMKIIKLLTLCCCEG